MLADYRAQLAGAREESNRIIEDSRKTADQLRRDLAAKAEEEAAATVARAQEEYRAERDRVFNDLRTQVGEIAVDIAGRVVGQSLDKKAHEKLIDDYIEQVAGEQGQGCTGMELLDRIFGKGGQAAGCDRPRWSRLPRPRASWPRSKTSCTGSPRRRSRTRSFARPYRPVPAGGQPPEARPRHPRGPGAPHHRDADLVLDRIGPCPRILTKIAEAVVEIAATSREHAVAEIRSAVPLTEKQRERLEKALSKATGRTVEAKVVVDPTVVGGVIARVDDLVFDGSVASRLEDAKHAFGS